MKRSFFASALTAGLVAGTLDIIAASLQTYIKGGEPIRMLKGIASGVFGPQAMSGSTMMAVWGLIFHFIIAISFTFFFFFLANQIPLLVKFPLPVAIVYGIFMWAFMKFIVLRLAFPTWKPPVLKDAAIACAILIVCIGIPVALFAKRYVRAKA